VIDHDDDIAISVRGLGKRYRMGAAREARSLMDQAGAIARGRWRDGRDAPTVWAVRDVTFDVPRGQVKGVLGRNGAGKTTLMQILARVTAPTEGRAVIRGRVGALFQVGTGFHPELSGRDNIALSGAILGMDTSRTAEMFDEIVAFSEIGDFLDTPVKHYSSGMYTRLAFSVSSHLDAEIMLVDEVLSVGDAGFQAKSRARIRDIVRDGRTVLYVSHNMSAVREICDSAMVLEDGRLEFDGDTDRAVAFYEQVNERTRTLIRETPPEAAAATL
jgi:lipopolysaccharide transport system ATP-binding protein